MPGLIAVSWDNDHELLANSLFERVCKNYTSIKGIILNAEVKQSHFRIARFARKSPSPNIEQNFQYGITAAIAGWWFNPNTNKQSYPSLADFIERYYQEQDKAFNEIQGAFLSVIINHRENYLKASGDRLGLFPIYMTETDGIAWISTSSTALAKSLKSSLDVEAVRALFMESAIRSPRSAFKNIRRITFGEQVTLKDGRASLHKVWIPFKSPQKYRNIHEAVDEGLSLLQNYCLRITNIYPQWICDLTGGFDSRLLAACMTKPGDKINITINGPESSLDFLIVKNITRQLNWSCYHNQLSPDWGKKRWDYFQKGIGLCEGELLGNNIDSVLQYKLSISKHFDASLTGSAGELYRDFFWQQEFLKIGRSKNIDIMKLLNLRFFLYSRPEMSLFEKDWKNDYLDDQFKVIQQIIDLNPDSLNTAKLDAIYIWKSSGHVGRYGGAVFPIIPSISPLTISNAVEFGISLPWKFRFREYIIRHMIARANPQLADIPTCYGGSANPFKLSQPNDYMPYLKTFIKKVIRKGAKKTFNLSIFTDPLLVPTNSNWDTDFIKLLESKGLLNINNLNSANLYDQDGLKKFFSSIGENFSLRSLSQLYAIISLEVLCRLCEINHFDEKV